MRTALSPIQIHSRRCRHPPWNLVLRAVPRQVARSLTTSSSLAPPSWSLDDLPRVSEHTSPLVFHLTSDDPYHNLSVEHHLLTRSHPASRILVFYTNRPCVVIGRNQNPWLEADLQKLARGGRLRNDHARSSSAAIDLVRRRSGGGTVFHGPGNLNYSVIVPHTKSFQRRTHAEMVVRALTSLRLFGPVKVNDRNDIVMRQATQWLKVSGSAYKLTRGRALHHGTLLYSSPDLDKIGDWLRSPGRDFIQAKGVESVRSQVGNLAYTPDSRQRDGRKEEITEAIVQTFWDMYGDGQSRQPGLNEVSVGKQGELPPSIAAGVAELMSDEWRFEQTPRFDFASGRLDGAEVLFHANRGVVERLTWKSPKGVVVEKHKADFADEVKLHNVKSWEELLRPVDKGGPPDEPVVPDALIRRIEAIFPRYGA